ncbi:MAG: hypothetical protein E6I88_10190 [Chloroflexi bacterium]|nr:MAG: hypothetical protein E6I88_10190 [Chloroflexota bacterium]TME48586.1 MAG: hypothetical protein E6I56_00610 [Chloroflexota bacterium]
MKRSLIALLAVAVTSCGAQAAADHGPPPSVSGTNGPFHAVASPSRLAAGGTVHLTLTVAGPIQYETACVQTLQIWTEDARHQQIWAEPVPAIDCMAIAYKTLAAGQTATFTAEWPTSSQLAPGSYSIHGLFLTALPLGAGMRVRENLPTLPIQISG